MKTKYVCLLASLAAVCGSQAAEGRLVTRLDGAGWTLDGAAVSVPHTWNAVDGADGRGRMSGDSASATSYVRRRGVYAHALPDRREKRRYFVRCLGAAQKATVRVNGQEIGRHVGSYTAFAFEATRWMMPCGNRLEIEVDNFVDGDVQPVQADFTVYGGLYRGVELIETDPVCIDCVTDGANGLVVDADPKTGDVVVHVAVDGGTNEVRRFAFPDFELWSPEHPKLYTVDVAVRQAGSVDTVRETFGFRTAEFREDGFYLNGKRRQIRGVNYHQDLDGAGWAVSEAQHGMDIALMKEMGADGVRTAHYPHADETYRECDRQGLLVWCEYPNVNNMGRTETYRRRSLDGIREMIAQHRNRPSIVCWSVANEYRTNDVVRLDWLHRLIGDFAAEARRLDPSRAVASATCRSYLRDVNMVTDVLGFNFYPGWYRGEADGMQATIEAALAETPRKTIAVSEYGAGGNVDCHRSADVRNRPLDPFHSEEYQAWVHHGNYLTLKDHPNVWGTYVWLMFDFGADVRREGSRFGLNDKGLVTFDHKTRKDAFCFYKANWRPELQLHLVGKRLDVTTNATTAVMAFYNGTGDVTLKVNGAVVSSVRPDAVKTAIWRDIALRPGPNAIEVSAGGRSETATWTYRVAETPAITVDGQDPATVGARVSLEADGRVLISATHPISTVRLAWKRPWPSDARVLNDAWERSMADLCWRPIEGTVGSPWYFLVMENGRTDGYGVKVQPNALAYWKVTEDGYALELDVTAGGHPVELGRRVLEAATIVRRYGQAGESAFRAGRAFCKMMCPKPRLPNEPVYGYNDWYCAYGKNTATNFLADAAFVCSLAEGLPNRPYVVMDDGWQPNSPPVVKAYNANAAGGSGYGPWDRSGDAFGMEMRAFAGRVRALGARPGLWYRPYRAWPGAPSALVNGKDPQMFDPTLPAVKEMIRADVRRFREWGFSLVKIDYLTRDLCGRFCPAEKDRVFVGDRGWSDVSRTSAEVLLDHLRTMREAAGDAVVLIGCNALNHLVAGLFELQRTGGDTSGWKWSQTRDMGVNTLGHRLVQDGVFFAVDADCVGLAKAGAVPWEKNRQWLDLVSRSGTPFFVSWQRSLATDEVRAALKAAFARAAVAQPPAEPLDAQTEKCPKTWSFGGCRETYNWE